jgi:hypothetical protein
MQIVKTKLVCLKALPMMFFLITICSLFLPRAGRAGNYNGFMPQLYQQEQSFHAAGLRGDHSQVPAMIQSLQSEPNPNMRKRVLMVLPK